jgi:hypothetical protein
MVPFQHIPGPFAAASASSPMKKSRSSVPRFIDRCPPGPAPPVRYDGLLATAGRPDPEPPLPAAAPFVAIAVGNTKEGESLPAKPRRAVSKPFQSRQRKILNLPSFENPVPLSIQCQLLAFCI